MKTVMKNADVIAAWVAQSQDSARNAAGSLYFTRDTLYSYGSHHAIARLAYGAGRAADTRYALVNADTYSVTTAKQTGGIYVPLHAAGVRVFRVPYVTAPAHKDAVYFRYDNWLHIVGAASASLASARRARTYRDLHMREARERCDDANAFARLTGAFRPVVGFTSDDPITAAAELAATHPVKLKRSA